MAPRAILLTLRWTSQDLHSLSLEKHKGILPSPTSLFKYRVRSLLVQRLQQSNSTYARVRLCAPLIYEKYRIHYQASESKEKFLFFFCERALGENPVLWVYPCGDSVAITILTLAVTGTFMTANNALVAAETSRDKLTASYLAQESVEYVRKLRDDAYLQTYSGGGTDVSGRAWSTFYAGSIVGCVAECDATILGLPPLSAPFTRRIRIDQLGSEIRITSVVSWDFHFIPYKVVIVDHLTHGNKK